MRLLSTLLFSLFLILSFVIRAQTADIVDGCAPLTVNFTPPTGSSSYFWDFKDGGTSILQSPSNTFITPGKYDVEFKNSATGSVVGAITIDVFEKPEPKITADKSRGCAPHRVNFSDATVLSPSVTVTQYSWVFEDGGTAFGNNVSHAFVTDGNFWVSLELKTSLPSCNATQQFNNFISVSDPPTVLFNTNPDPPTACVSPLNLSFTNLSASKHTPLKYQWKFEDQNNSTLENPPALIYNADGNYYITLIVTDTNDCSDSISKVASVGSPVVDFFLKTFPDTICKNVQDTLFNNSSAGVYLWDFDPSINEISRYLGIHPIIEFTQGGLIPIELKVFAGGCSADTTINFFVDEATADFDFSPYRFCNYPAEVSFVSLSNNVDSLFWDFGNDSTFIGENPTFLYPKEDTTIYGKNGETLYLPELTVVSEFGCRNTKISDSVVRIHEANALIIPDLSRGCIPLAVTFSDSSTFNPLEPIVKWEWFSGDGDFVSSTMDTAQTFIYDVSGEYGAYLVVTNSVGCTDTSYITIIKAGEKIKPEFTVDKTSICLGDTVTLSDNTSSLIKDSIDVWHYVADGNRLFHCFDESETKWRFNDEIGSQDISLITGFNGCFDSTIKVAAITVDGSIAKFGFDLDCADPYKVQLNNLSSNADVNSWDFGDGQVSSDLNPEHTYLNQGDYEITLVTSKSGSGCGNDTAILPIFINEVKSEFTIDTILCQNIEYKVFASKSEGASDQCEDGPGYLWIFSDTLMPQLRRDNPIDSFIFPTRGNNELTLIVSDKNGCKDTSIQSLEVFGLDIEFALDQTQICIPLKVNSTENSSGDTTLTKWTWDFDDGTVFSVDSGVDTSHLYINYTPFLDVKLLVEDTLGCKDSLFKQLSMYQPTSTVVASDYFICSGEEISFTATDYTTKGSNLTFNWNFDDGDTSSLQNPLNTYDSSGIYSVELAIEEVKTSCKDTIIQTIEVADFPKAEFVTDSDSSNFICPNSNLIFTDSSKSSYRPLNYKWDFGNGRTSTLKNPGTVYINNGIYEVVMIATIPAPYNCSDTNDRTFNVRGPSGSFETDLGTDTICRLETVLFTLKDTADVDQFKWEFGDGSEILNIDSINHQYTFAPPSGKTIAKLILSNADGSCKEPLTTDINIHAVVADFERNNGIDTGICFAPYPITNISINATEWNWDFGDGTTSTLRNPAVLNYQKEGTYDISLAVLNNRLGCNDSIVKTIILHPIPEIEVIGDTLCEGEISFAGVTNPDPAWIYSWTTNRSLDLGSDSSRPIIRNRTDLTTELYINVTDTNGCFDEDTTSIFVINPLNLTDFDTIIVIGDSIALPVYVNAGLYNFVWNPEEGLSCLDCSPPKAQPLEDIIYNLKLSDILGCFTYDVDFDIKVHPETFIKLPTSFTPNGDGNNDKIFVEGWGIKELLEYQIYNRWGELIFETQNLEQGWDGHFKGVLQNNDVYVFKVRVKTWRDEEKFLEGYINLIR